MSRHTLFCIILPTAIVLALFWFAHPYLLRAMAQWFDVGERPQPTDYVMVQGGDETTRPFTAAALIKAGYARYAIAAKIKQSPNVSARVLPPTHEIIRQSLIKCGVPERNILILPGEAATTFDEAAALAAFLENRPTARVLVITSDFHTRRSRWIFAGMLADRAGQVSFVSAPTDIFPLDRWWHYEEGFTTIANEYAKLAFYIVRYGRFAYWLAACGVLMLTIACVRRRNPILSPAAE